MKISFENFGKADRGEILLNDLTIICGPNGSGKTYASYAVFGCLDHFSEFLDFKTDEELLKSLSLGQPIEIHLNEVIEKFSENLKGAGQKFKNGLDDFFNAPSGFFADAKFDFEFSDDEVKIPNSYYKTVNFSKKSRLDFELNEGTTVLRAIYSGDDSERVPRQIFRRILANVITNCILGEAIPDPFVVTSERTGVSLFYKELDINRNAILSHISSGEKIDPFKVLQAMQSRYAQPIQHNIDLVRDYGNVSKGRSFLRDDKSGHSEIFELLGELIGGSFRDSDNQLTFNPKKERNKPKLAVPLYIASSSIKSLFLIDMYINYIAQRNGILIIDEPELNLHPDNQVKIARLVARLVNSGVKVLVTTHSDYFIREINNLITLGGVGAGREPIMRKYGYHKMDLLNASAVTAYCSVPNRGIIEMAKTSSGLDTAIFDEIISKENFKSQDIFSMVD